MLQGLCESASSCFPPRVGPWGVPLILHARLPGRRTAPKYIVRVSENSRMSADALCAKLRAAGGACIVLRNPPG